MALFAIYRKTKRTKALALIEWPRVAPRMQDAQRAALVDRLRAGAPISGLRFLEWHGTAAPPARIAPGTVLFRAASRPFDTVVTHCRMRATLDAMP